MPVLLILCSGFVSRVYPVPSTLSLCLRCPICNTSRTGLVVLEPLNDMMLICSLFSASQMKINRLLKFTAVFTLSGWIGEDPQNLELLNSCDVQLKLGIEGCLLYNCFPLESLLEGTSSTVGADYC